MLFRGVFDRILLLFLKSFSSSSGSRPAVYCPHTHTHTHTNSLFRITLRGHALEHADRRALALVQERRRRRFELRALLRRLRTELLADTKRGGEEYTFRSWGFGDWKLESSSRGDAASLFLKTTLSSAERLDDATPAYADELSVRPSPAACSSAPAILFFRQIKIASSQRSNFVSVVPPRPTGAVTRSHSTHTLFFLF